MDAEAAQIETVRTLIPRFETKIQRVLDRVWGNAVYRMDGMDRMDSLDKMDAQG